MLKTTAETARLFRCRLEELGPLNDMVLAMFTTNQADFGMASPDYLDKDYLKDWNAHKAAFAELVPTGVRRASDKEVTRTMTQVSKSLRDPLNFLNLRLNRAAKKGGLTASAEDFGLGQVRTEITTRDMEGLDSALGHLLQLLQQPANSRPSPPRATPPPTRRPSPPPASSSAPSTPPRTPTKTPPSTSPTRTPKPATPSGNTSPTY